MTALYLMSLKKRPHKRPKGLSNEKRNYITETGDFAMTGFDLVLYVAGCFIVVGIIAEIGRYIFER